MPKATDVIITGKSTKISFLSRLNQFGKWVQGIYPDEKSLPKVKQLVAEGIKNELKTDENGDYYINFSRPPDKTDRAGRKFMLTPPVVVDKDNRHFEDQLGAGSDIAIRVETYGGKTPIGSNYKAARLGGVKVYNHVPYEPMTMADNRFDERTAKSLAAEPEPTDW